MTAAMFHAAGDARNQRAGLPLDPPDRPAVAAAEQPGALIIEGRSGGIGGVNHGFASRPR